MCDHVIQQRPNGEEQPPREWEERADTGVLGCSVAILCCTSAAERNVQVLKWHFSVGAGLQLHLADPNIPQASQRGESGDGSFLCGCGGILKGMSSVPWFGLGRGIHGGGTVGSVPRPGGQLPGAFHTSQHSPQ